MAPPRELNLNVCLGPLHAAMQTSLPRNPAESSQAVAEKGEAGGVVRAVVEGLGVKVSRSTFPFA